MITVRRSDVPERTDRNGNVRPATYSCRYYYRGTEIAKYFSWTDTIYLNTDHILRDFSKPYYYRALNGKLSEAYAYLFEMLGADETSRMSEYINGI